MSERRRSLCCCPIYEKEINTRSMARRRPISQSMSYFSNQMEFDAYKKNSLNRLMRHVTNYFTVGNKVGQGGNGSVFDVRDRRNGARFVVKLMPMTHKAIRSDQIQQDFDITRRLAEAGITVPIVYSMSESVEYAGYQYSEGYMVMEKGDIVKKFNSNDILQIFRRFIKMTRMDIFCSDIKPSNTIRYRNEVYLIDFDHTFCNEGSLPVFLKRIIQLCQHYSKNTPSLLELKNQIERKDFTSMDQRHGVTRDRKDVHMLVAMIQCMFFSHMLRNPTASEEFFKRAWG